MSKEKININKDMMYKKIMPSSLKDRNESFEIALTKINSKNEKLILNINEVVVKEKLENALSRFNCCRCDRCRNDIVALTLNSIESKYVVCEESSVKEMVESVDPIPINSALIRSIVQVRNNPRH